MTVADTYIEQYAHFLDTNQPYMESAAEAYFFKLFNDSAENPTVKVIFKSKGKQKGAQVSDSMNK